MKKDKEIIRYGEAFKRQIESGRHSGAYAASRAYGIKGSETVKRWLLRYGDVDTTATAAASTVAASMWLSCANEGDGILKLDYYLD